MQAVKRSRRVSIYASAARRLGMSLCVLLGASTSSIAQPTTSNPASILFFPRVVADTDTDTLIQIGNAGNNLVKARCFYIAGDTCAQTEFSLSLRKQQPTHWVASRGRPTNPNDAACSEANFDCDGAGFDPGDPGDVPPVADGFHGLLVCVEIGADGTEISGNHLLGEASVVDKASGDLSQYTAVGLQGDPETNDGNHTLCLGGGTTEACPNGPEYNGCPDTWVVNFLPDRATDPIVGGSATVNTRFVAVPCARNLATAAPSGVSAQILVFDQHATRSATSTSFGCWTDKAISMIDSPTGQRSLFGADVIGNGGAQMRIHATTGGIIILPYEIHHSGDVGDATAAAEAHADGSRAQTDLLTLPEAVP